MIFPSIHRNGTSAERLLESIVEAGNALREALTALEETAPNARDYYPQGPNAFSLASAEHLSRVLHVKSVLDELAVLSEYIADHEGK